MPVETLTWRFRSRYETSPLKPQIDVALAYAQRLNYRPLVILNFLREWIHFAYELTLKRVPFPTSIDDPEVEEYIRRNWTRAIERRHREVRGLLRFLIEVNQKGNVDLKKAAPHQTLPSVLVPAGHDFILFLEHHRNASPSSLRWARYSLTHLGNYLERHGLARFGDVSPVALRDYGLALVRYKPRTRGKHLSVVRALLRWAHMTGLLAENLARVVAGPRLYDQATIPEILTPAEAKAVLLAVDRSKPSGLRNYAILLLAARYGLRPSDIRQLSLDHIDWRGSRIKLVQSKTDRVLELPLLPDVTRALVAYLKHGRPKTTVRNVFVRSCAPHRAFGPFDNLYHVIKKPLLKAGVLPRRGQRGLYLLRHSLAGQMIAAGQPLKAISDVLGHACPDSTFWYTKSDVEGLRSVAVSLEEVLR